MERFWDIIEDININKVLLFLRDNIIGTTVLVTAMLWIPAGCIINYVDRRRKREILERWKWRTSGEFFHLNEINKVIHLKLRRNKNAQLSWNKIFSWYSLPLWFSSLIIFLKFACEHIRKNFTRGRSSTKGSWQVCSILYYQLSNWESPNSEKITEYVLFLFFFQYNRKNLGMEKKDEIITIKLIISSNTRKLDCQMNKYFCFLWTNLILNYWIVDKYMIYNNSFYLDVMFKNIFRRL